MAYVLGNRLCRPVALHPIAQSVAPEQTAGSGERRRRGDHLIDIEPEHRRLVKPQEFQPEADEPVVHEKHQDQVAFFQMITVFFTQPDQNSKIDDVQQGFIQEEGMVVLATYLIQAIFSPNY
jgi:hypothetical protein